MHTVTACFARLLMKFLLGNHYNDVIRFENSALLNYYPKKHPWKEL